MKSKFFLTLLMLVGICWGVSYAEKVSIETAEKVAKNYIQSIPKFDARSAVQLTHTVFKDDKRGQSLLRQSGANEDVYYYVFNINNDQGFVIVSGDDVAVPVLGYSDNGKYDENNLPPNFVYWMDCLSQEIASAKENKLRQSAETKVKWKELESGNNVSLRAGNSVGPLIQTRWNQTPPYNDRCPGGSYTGCVATAMAQIMKYHTTPVTRTASIPGYTTTTNQWTIDAITGTTSYAWNYMTDTYSSSSSSAEKDAVAILMYHCGVSVEMDYTTSGSGANSQKVGVALVNYFGYDPSIQFKSREYYTDTEWENMLKNELDVGRPVYYAGSNPASGHAFICDGYNNSGQFHFNWGWGGLHDGYFVTTSLNPGTGGAGAGAGTYNQKQKIIINIKSNEGGIYVPEIKIRANTHITSDEGSVDRGQYFTVNAPLSNSGLLPFTGKGGVALVDNADQILSIIGQYDFTLEPGQYYSSYNLSCAVPASVNHGGYKLRVVYKSPTDSQWSIAKGSPGYTDVLDLTVTNNPPRTHGLKIYQDSHLTSTATSVKRGETFTASAQFINRGTTDATGDYGIALVDDNDIILAIIGSYIPSQSLPPNAQWEDPFDIPCQVSQNISAGNYYIRAVFKPAGENWSIVYKESSNIDILPLTVQDETIPDGSSLRVYRNPSVFGITPDPIVQNSSVSVIFGLINMGTIFVGDIELSLCNSNGDVVEIIETKKIGIVNDSYYHSYTFNSPKIMSPGGTYILTVFQKSVVGQRKKVANYDSSMKNEVEVIVTGILPAVTAVSPVDGATDVPVSGQLSITFNMPMITSPETGVVTLSGGGGVVNNENKSWSSDNKVCTVSYSGLDYNTYYTFDISGFKDESGNEMDAITAGCYSFTTVPLTLTLTLARGRNWYLSSPVSTATANTAFAGADYVEYYDETRKVPYSATDQTIDGWVSIKGSTDALTPGKGYVVWANGEGTSDVTYTFTGAPNTGNITVPLTRTDGVEKSGFNLVGNPYPDYYEWTAPASNISSTIWYRTRDNSEQYVFATYNANGGQNTNSGSQYIPPMQAFWVYLEDGINEKNLVFDNANRNTGGDGGLLKASAVDKTPKIRLVVGNGTRTDETLIYANANAADGYDVYDSPKMADNAPEIYTVTANSNNRLAINGLSAIAGTVEIPLGIHVDKYDAYSISATEAVNLGDLQPILKDNVLNTEFDLSSGGAYRFTSDAADNTSRFSAVFRSKEVGNMPNPVESEIAVYARNSTLYVESPVPVKQVQVYDPLGRLLYSAKEHVIYNVKSGIHIVKVETANGTVSRKVTVR